jgi:tetratricopeptide (TPR) repeat protein
VSAQLVDARAGYQLWSETYDRRVDDIFAIQDEIAGAVTRQLQLALLGGGVTVRETDPRAYTLYLQARHVGRQHTRDSLEQAVSLYRQALAIDPAYLPAWDGLAGVYLNLAGFVLMPRHEAFGRAREAALSALAVDPNYAAAHGRLGWLALYETTDLAAAADHYRHALDLDPGDETLRSNAAVLLVALGRLHEAIVYLETAAARDPVSATAHANLANAYLLARRYAEAEQSIRRAITLSPEYAGAHYRLGRVLLALGDVNAAEAAFAAEPLPGGVLIGRALVADSRGDVAASDAAIRELEALYGDQAAGNYAQILAHRGDADAAFEWLELEYASNGAGGFLEYRWDPLFDPLRDDPRWSDLMTRAGFGDEEVAAIEFPPLVGTGV